MARAFLFALALGACASQRPATEIFLVVDADPALRADATSVRLIVSGTVVGGATETALDRTITGAGLTWPLSVGIIPRANDATRGISIESTLTTTGGMIATTSARTGFVPEETRTLTLVHDASCVGIDCAVGETCDGGLCVTDAIDPRTLPVRGGDAGP